ncbi:MAG: cation diffusion facilitator family transporter [Polyangiaceae bacterium]
MSSEEHSTGHILQSLAVNVVIAISKFVAAAITGSGAMLAEAIHSSSDCANQLLLLFGVRQAKRKPDASHPLGYGRELYFWSFMVAMLLFTGGGVFSIYEGIHKIMSPEEKLDHVEVGLVVLGIALVLEGGSTISNIRELNKRRKAVPFFRYLKETKDSDLILVFGENAAATMGLICALATTLLAKFTGNMIWDGVGGLAVGVVLVGVAFFLAYEVKSLLVGESADEEVTKAVNDAATASKHIGEVLRLITVQQGPGEIMVACKVRLESDISGKDMVAAINAFERDVKARCPAVAWSFVEPDDQV